MKLARLVLLFLFLFTASIFSITSNINVQFLISDIENGTFQGDYHITFGIFNAPNLPFEEALWKETHQLTITEGSISQLLGSDVPLDFNLFKNDDMYIGLSFQEISDTLYVPLISVPAALVSKYSVYAQEIEYTSNWMKINTENHQVGIGITQNLTVDFEVVGTSNFGVLNSDQINSPDGSGIENIDYFNIVNLDDFSLSPYDFNDDSPTVDVVFVTTERNVGVGIYVTADINEQLHVSGNIKIDNGGLLGKSNLELFGDGGATSESYNDDHQLIWDSVKGFFHAGYGSGDRWSRSNSGINSAAFGRDNLVSGDYSFSVGLDNSVLKSSSTITGGQDNSINSKLSAILSGYDNEILESVDTNGGVLIGGGQQNTIQGDYAVIAGGYLNQILNTSVGGSFSGVFSGYGNEILEDSKYSAILGGRNNIMYGSSSYSFGSHIEVGSSGSSHDGVFVFADSTLTEATPLNTFYSDQVLLYATNGFLMGFDNFDNKAAFSLDDFSPAKIYPPTGEVVKDFSIRVAGDIVSAAEDGTLGYLVGDGRFITNIESLWGSDSSNSALYVDDKRIGIGATNDFNPADNILFIKEVAGVYPANARWQEVTGDETLDIGIYSSNSIITSSLPLKLQYDNQDVAEITDTDNGEFIVHTRLGIGLTDPTYELDIIGNAQISGELDISVVNATTFVGDGSLITDVPVYFMSPQDGAPFKQLVMDSVGHVGLGPVTNNIQALLHIGDATGVQIRLEETDDVSSRYTEFSSNSRFDLTFYDYIQDSDEVYSFNSVKKGTGGTSEQLMVITGEGNVSIGSPFKSDKLTVSGNVLADSFEGNGASITDVQLDVEQTNNVTFNATVSLDDVLKLVPQASTPTCDNDGIGSIYSKTNSGGILQICVCVADSTIKNLTGDSDADCL